MRPPLLLACAALALSACGSQPAPVPTPEPPVVVLAPAPSAAAPAPPSTAPTPGGAAPPVATARPSGRAPSCRVVVGKLLGAERFSGPGPISPAMRAQLDADPAFARAYWGISHGDQHIQCRYRVQIDGASYAYTYIVGNTWGHYDVDHCKVVREDVAKQIRQVTRGCTDLAGGAYYGYVFTPLP